MLAAYLGALRSAQRLVHLENQFLWAVLTERVGEIQERYAASELSAHVATVAASFSEAELRTILRWFRALSGPGDD